MLIIQDSKNYTQSSNIRRFVIQAAMLSPLSSPEKMDYSEESSFDELPVFARSNSSQTSVERRISCPPKIQDPIRRPASDLAARNSRVSSLGCSDALSGLEHNLNFLVLESTPQTLTTTSDRGFLKQVYPWGEKLDEVETASTILQSSMLSRNSALSQSSKRSSFTPFFVLGSGDTQSTAESDSDDSTSYSTSTVRTAPASKPRLRQSWQPSKRSGDDLNQLNQNSGISGQSECLSDTEDLAADGKSKKTRLQKNSSNSFCKSFIKFVCCIMLITIVCLAALVVMGVYLRRKDEECAQKSPDFIKLESDFISQVYGQHIAVESVLRSLKEFFHSSNNKPTIVMSFHGWTGVGKNHVAGIVSNAFVNAHVVKLIIPLHFPHESEAELYSLQIEDWIRTNVSECAVNVFILDEMDKANLQLIQGLKLVLMHLKNSEKPTKSVFMLLSNSGGSVINKISLDHASLGNKRETLSREVFVDALVGLAPFTPDEYRWYVELGIENLIDLIVPFLPLEASHVEECVRSYIQMREQQLDDETIRHIVKDFEYFPAYQPRFAKAGCKRVADFTALAIE